MDGYISFSVMDKKRALGHKKRDQIEKVLNF